MNGIDTFEHPVLGIVAALLGLFAWWASVRGQPDALAWPSFGELHSAGARAFDPARHVALALRAGALLGLAAAVAGPVQLHPVPIEAGRGLDVVLAVDTSGSMRALDGGRDGDPRTRLDLAREAVAHFAQHRAAEGDRVGLVVFGDDALTQSPLTSDGRLLAAAAARIEAGMAGESTALGDALALAVKRAGPLSRADAAGGARSRGVAADAREGASSRVVTTRGEGTSTAAAMPVAGRVVVLLTDGRSNAGRLPPDVAAAIARAHGVRVHAVGLGSDGAVAMAAESPGAVRVRVEQHDLDSDTLRAIATATGGRYFAAHTSNDLAVVYDEIDALERVARTERPKPRRAPRPEPFLILASSLLALEILLARVLWRTIP